MILFASRSVGIAVQRCKHRYAQTTFSYCKSIAFSRCNTSVTLTHSRLLSNRLLKTRFYRCDFYLCDTEAAVIACFTASNPTSDTHHTFYKLSSYHLKGVDAHWVAFSAKLLFSSSSYSFWNQRLYLFGNFSSSTVSGAMTTSTLYL